MEQIKCWPADKILVKKWSLQVCCMQLKKSLEKKRLRIPASIGLRFLGFCSKLFVRIKASKKKSMISWLTHFPPGVYYQRYANIPLDVWK